MKIGVCGIACEICPKMVRGECPVGESGCYPREKTRCAVCKCAYDRGVQYCFTCKDFPCDLTKESPVSFEFCEFISGKE